MTGWLNTPAFVSNTTLQSFADIGYTIAVIPDQVDWRSSRRGESPWARSVAFASAAAPARRLLRSWCEGPSGADSKRRAAYFVCKAEPPSSVRTSPRVE